MYCSQDRFAILFRFLSLSVYKIIATPCQIIAVVSKNKLNIIWKTMNVFITESKDPFKSAEGFWKLIFHDYYSVAKSLEGFNMYRFFFPQQCSFYSKTYPWFALTKLCWKELEIHMVYIRWWRKKTIKYALELFSSINRAKMQRETFKVFLICKTPLHVPFHILK